jgi:hypothetical protein
VPRSVAIVTDEDGHAHIAYEYDIRARRLDEDGRAKGASVRADDGDPEFDGDFPRVTLRFPSPSPGIALVRLFDVRGCLVREWRDLEVSRGVHPLEWDGRSANGERAPAGVYFWEVSITGSEGEIRTRAKNALLSR